MQNFYPTSPQSKLRKYLAYLFLFPIVWMSFKASNYWPIFRIPFFAYIIASLLLFTICRGYLRQDSFKFLLFYGIVVLLHTFLGSEAFPTLFSALYDTFIMLIPVSMFYYVTNTDNSQKFVYSIFIIWGVLFIYEVYIAYRLDIEYSGLLRNLEAVRYEDMKDVFIRMGLPTYALPHALPTLIPALILILKKKNVKLFIRIIIGIILLATLLLIYISQATGPYLMAIFALVLSWIAKPGDVSKNVGKIIPIAIIVLPFMLFPTLSDDLLDVAKNYISQDNDVYEKIVEMEDGGEGGDIEFRGQLLNKTIDTIFEHPLWGSSVKTWGNHHALIDRWAKLGLLGFFPLAIFLFLVIRKTYYYLPETGRIYYAIGTLSAILMITSKNMMSWEQWFLLFFMLPVAILINEDTKKDKLLKNG